MTKVIINTNHGNIEFELLPDIAPETVRNFIKLSKSGFYDGTLFHRVIPKFMIQGGDPNTKKSDKTTWGTGGPGYNIKAEFNPRSHLRGIVSMARSSDPDSWIDSILYSVKLRMVWRLLIKSLINPEMVTIALYKKPKCFK